MKSKRYLIPIGIALIVLVVILMFNLISDVPELTVLKLRTEARSEYSSNEKRLIGKRVVVKGNVLTAGIEPFMQSRISEMGIDPKYNHKVTLIEGNNLFSKLECFFIAGYANQIEKLQIGQFVRIEGICSAQNGMLRLENCKIK